jgi:hypothetical protein
MKKILILIMVVAMASLALFACTPAATTPQQTTPAATEPPVVELPPDPGYGLDGKTPTDVSVFKYKELKDGTIAITGVYTQGSELSSIVIPALIEGKKVSTIDASGLATLKKDSLSGKF